MATNYVQDGDVVMITAPDGTDDSDIASGGGVLIGSMFGVAVTAIAKGEDGPIKTTGVFMLPKTSAQAWTVGLKVYWDASAGVVTSSSGGNTLIGVATAVAANPSSTGRVRLNGSF